MSAAGEVANNVHIDACLTDALGLDVDTTVSYQSSGVGVISACPDPDAVLDGGNGPKESALSGNGLLCTLDGYQESDGNMGGDFEYHARVNSEVAGTQTVIVCADPDGDGCGTNDTILDTITVTWVAAEPETGMLMIMKHYGNADDSNPDTTVDVSEEEFMEVEAGGGDNEVLAIALTILACPVERLPGDEPAPDSIAHFEEECDFLVTDSTGATFTLDDATFNQALVCEQDKEVASGPDPIVIGEVDGDEATNVCVDFSFYSIDGVAEGEVTVVETFHDGEHEFGTVRFTPAALDPDDDSRTLVDFNRQTSTVNIDTSLDDECDGHAPHLQLRHGSRRGSGPDRHTGGKRTARRGRRLDGRIRQQQRRDTVRDHGDGLGQLPRLPHRGGSPHAVITPTNQVILRRHFSAMNTCRVRASARGSDANVPHDHRLVRLGIVIKSCQTRPFA